MMPSTERFSGAGWADQPIDWVTPVTGAIFRASQDALRTRPNIIGSPYRFDPNFELLSAGI